MSSLNILNNYSNSQNELLNSVNENKKIIQVVDSLCDVKGIKQIKGKYDNKTNYLKNKFNLSRESEYNEVDSNFKKEDYFFCSGSNRSNPSTCHNSTSHNLNEISTVVSAEKGSVHSFYVKENPILKKKTSDTRNKRQRWKRAEEIELFDLIEKYGEKFDVIARRFPSRTSKELIERYREKLNPNLNRNKFSAEEDLKIISLHQKFGGKWTRMSNLFPGRNSSMLKNRFYSFLNKSTLFTFTEPEQDYHMFDNNDYSCGSYNKKKKKYLENEKYNEDASNIEGEEIKLEKENDYCNFTINNVHHINFDQFLDNSIINTNKKQNNYFDYNEDFHILNCNNYFFLDEEENLMENDKYYKNKAGSILCLDEYKQILKKYYNLETIIFKLLKIKAESDNKFNTSKFYLLIF